MEWPLLHTIRADFSPTWLYETPCHAGSWTRTTDLDVDPPTHIVDEAEIYDGLSALPLIHSYDYIWSDSFSTWQHEIPHHAGSLTRTTGLDVGPPTNIADEAEIYDGSSALPLRLPYDYIWSGELEGYQKHFDYQPYDRFGGQEIIDDMTGTSKLGSGGFGNVRRVLCKGRLLARKEMLPQQGDFDVRREARILENLVHRHIVELAGTYTQDGTLYLLLYPVADCNLAQMLQMPRSESWANHLRTACGCLASSLVFIHSRGIAIKHKDIKPTNILFMAGIVFLADWGLSNCFKNKDNSRSQGWTYCTPAYAAPEVRDRAERGTAQDIFSLGLVYMEMLGVLYRYTVLDQRSIGESRVVGFPGLEMTAAHISFLAALRQRDSPRNPRSRAHHLQPQLKEFVRARSWNIVLQTLCQTMVAKSPADRPTARHVLQLLKAPQSLNKPCAGCLRDEACNKDIDD